MTNQDNITIIREACIKVNPEIGGTKNRYKYEKCSECYGYGYLVDPSGENASDCFTCGGTCRERIEWLETIIGRPIRLADVLLAIQDKIVKQWEKDNARLDTLGNWQPYLEEMGLKTIKKWNLLKDDLTLQSKETIDFLCELLK